MGKRKSKAAKQKQAKAKAKSKSKTASAAFGVSVQRGAKGRRRGMGNGEGKEWQSSSLSTSSEGGGKRSVGKILGAAPSDTAETTTTKKTTAAASAKCDPLLDKNLSKRRGVVGATKRIKFGSHKFVTTTRIANSLAADAAMTTTREESKSKQKREDDNFDAQYESMRERIIVRNGVGCGGRKKKARTAASSSPRMMINLAPATLRLGDALTAEEMVSQTADRVARGMIEIGGSGSANGVDGGGNDDVNVGREGASAAPNLLQILAAKKREEWARESKMKEGGGGGGVVAAMGRDNRFAAFIEDDDDDDEDEMGEKSLKKNDCPKPAPAFNFAPASFAFVPTFQSEGTAAVAPPLSVLPMGKMGEYDPDL